MFLARIMPNGIKTIVKLAIIMIRQKLKRSARFFVYGKKNDGYTFAILCVKNSAYVKLVIDNVNSLHYLNPEHKVTVYCDDKCAKVFADRMDKFDYKDKVEIKNVYGDGERPWQYYKVETLIDSSKNDNILIDADSRWHDEPVVVKDKINMLVVAYKIKDNQNESKLAEQVFGNLNWVEFSHYVTGFVYIPPKFMTEKLAGDLRSFVLEILNDPLDFIDEKNRNSLKRLAEELAVNFALQSNHDSDMIVSLKEQDGPGSNKVMESLYYGCINQVNI